MSATDKNLTDPAIQPQLRRMGPIAALEITFSLTRPVSFERVMRNRMHRHSFFEPCIVISGTGEFECDGEVHALRRGSLFSADPGVYHEIRSTDTGNLRLYFLAFHVIRTARPASATASDDAAQAALSRFLLGHRVIVDDQMPLIPLFEHAAELSRPNATGKLVPFHREATLLLVTQIVAALRGDAQARPEAESGRAFHRRLIDAIERRLQQPLSIADLAEECCTSERTLRRRWRQYGNEPLTTEINWRRMERARQLLLLPDVSVSEAGYQVGMKSPARFSRLFRQMTGWTPSAYRARYLAKSPGASTAGPPFRTEFIDGEHREYLA